MALINIVLTSIAAKIVKILTKIYIFYQVEINKKIILIILIKMIVIIIVIIIIVIIIILLIITIEVLRETNAFSTLGKR